VRLAAAELAGLLVLSADELLGQALLDPVSP
jgi:hypothetical protein